MTTPNQARARRFPDGAVVDRSDCLICASENLDDAAVVFRDDLWACEVTPGYEVPGWFFLRVRRHALGWQELDEGELASFGERAKRLVEAITVVTDAPTTYLFNFGESYGHFHCLFVARTDEIPPERRTGNILQLRGERRDPGAALALVPAVRQAYRSSVTAR